MSTKLELRKPGQRSLPSEDAIARLEGRAEDIGESWAMARVLGAKGIPNRVDDWGPTWHHDWPTWREMLPKYLTEMLG